MNLLGHIWSISMLIYWTQCGPCIPSRLRKSSVSLTSLCWAMLRIVATRICAEQPSSSNSHIESLKRQLATSQYHVHPTNRKLPNSLFDTSDE